MSVRRGSKCGRKKARNRKANYKRYVYLGKRVPDVGRPGLDSPSEFKAIARAIARDVKSGRIDKRTANGRFLLLQRLTNPKKNSKVRSWSPRTREEVRNYIRKIRKEVL